jgi:hypothetical protein
MAGFERRVSGLVLAVIVALALFVPGQVSASKTRATVEVTLAPGEYFMLTCTGGSRVEYGDNGEDQIIGWCVPESR